MFSRQRTSTRKHGELLRGSGVAGSDTLAEVGANGSLQAQSAARLQTAPNACANGRRVAVRNGRWQRLRLQSAGPQKQLPERSPWSETSIRAGGRRRLPARRGLSFREHIPTPGYLRRDQESAQL